VTDLEQRYGSAGWNRKVVIALIVVLAGAGLSWLAWVVLELGRPDARADLISYEVTGTHSAHARFVVVRRDAEVAASCLLRALAADHTIVGERDVPVGPGEPTTTTVRRTIRTERLATSVLMVGCVTDEQTRRR
jgi:hypothetical protein